MHNEYKNSANDISLSTVVALGTQNPINMASRSARNYYVEDFLLPSDDGVVSARTFNHALSYIASIGGGVLHLLDKLYDVTDTPITSGGQNAVIPLPYTGINSENIVIKICGTTSIQAYSPPVPSSGSIICCSTPGSVANGIQSSVIGYGAASHSTISWNAITIELENITIRVEAESGMVPVDLYAVSNAILTNVTVSINAPPGSIPQAKNTAFVGVKLPASGNFGIVKVQKTYIIGFYDGMWFSEHADLDVFFQNCTYALHAPDSWSHIAIFRQVTTQGCSYSIRSSAAQGAAYTNSICGWMSIERDPELPFVADFYVDEGCELRGSISYVIAASPDSGISHSGLGSFYLVTHSIPLSQYQQDILVEQTSNDRSINPNAWLTIVVPQALANNITVTIANAVSVGQRVRIYSFYAKTVMVSTIANMYFPDNSNTTEYEMLGGFGSAAYVELLWDNNSWLVNIAGNVITQTVRTLGYTVATLPAGSEGMRAYVTDAISPSFQGVLVGGGGTICPAFYNGAAWVAG